MSVRFRSLGAKVLGFRVQGAVVLRVFGFRVLGKVYGPWVWGLGLGGAQGSWV